MDRETCLRDFEILGPSLCPSSELRPLRSRQHTAWSTGARGSSGCYFYFILVAIGQDSCWGSIPEDSFPVSCEGCTRSVTQPDQGRETVDRRILWNRFINEAVGVHDEKSISSGSQNAISTRKPFTPNVADTRRATNPDFSPRVAVSSRPDKSSTLRSLSEALTDALISS